MIKVYITADKGNGEVIKINEVENISELEIMLWMFDKNTVITFEEIIKKNEYEKQEELNEIMSNIKL